MILLEPAYKILHATGEVQAADHLINAVLRAQQLSGRNRCLGIVLVFSRDRGYRILPVLRIYFATIRTFSADATSESWLALRTEFSIYEDADRVGRQLTSIAIC